jgi:hypothetical protein
VNMAVDGDRLPERQIRRFEFRISCPAIGERQALAGLACTSATGG